MKSYLTFILLQMVSFICTAQNSKINTVDDAIAIKPSFTLTDISDKSLSIATNIATFSDFKYIENLKMQPNWFDMSVSIKETKRSDYHSFSLKHLKKSFFRDYNITYRRGELERLLPRSLDPTYYNPCIGGD